ncbi:MAG TPA: molecular chaperone DnaK [Polyangiaceae bacterium]|jgi:molecular chaperone DnaK|nr:MAG: Chaperone protein DnaK [Deltaproteobacteria bacterium ADurb.Bin207]HNS98041.1 molecular chaperone DnaK [Polyangiaceae bacterium]HNZ24733.1 molecular chaperone DnaK [Polyangiaceae bacterium]HOD24914.1 molecular chaperone DnaK [Polyangiaceae bacterium]HOE51139.1 molecular chaperone DnaK [Polyangiaceae bacterium]
MDRVIGIDLGTTNSCVAIVDDGTPTVIPNRGGYKTTPSMVAVTEAGKRLVGHIAKRQAITNAENTVSAAKRLIGRKWNSSQVKNSVLTSSYQIVEGPHADVRIKLRDNSYSVPEISAMVLQEMRVIAEDFLSESVSKAVITVPAYFNDNQRQAVRDAGQIAGLDVIRIINEPTAAALAYGFGKNYEKLIAVYDLGGGTFDISILEIGAHGVFKVIATAGDTFLGGEDFDALIIDWLVQSFKEQHDIDLRQDRMALQRLKDAAEKAKCELSSVKETEINLPFIISSGRNEALHLQQTISRQTLETLCEDLVQRTVEICRQTMLDARLDKDEIEDVILVGGMTRMPRVQEAVAGFFQREPCKGVHPDEVVALGAAIQGAALVDDAHEMILLDVTPHSLGIMTFGSVFEELIAQNTTVPTAQTKIFTTSRDNQTAVKILVMQKEGQQADDFELLGEFILTNLRRAPKGQVEIEVTFEINADGIVNVSAKDMETGQGQSIQVTASSGLTKDEISNMIESAKEYMVERRSSEEFEAARQEAETLIAEIERLFPQVEVVVAASDFGREAVNKARRILKDAKSAIESRDLNQVKSQTEALARTHRMFKGVVTKTQ